MRAPACVMIVCVLTAGQAMPGVASAQAPASSESECATLRQRLADHASLSEGVRRAIAAQVAAPTAAQAPATAPGRADAARARIEAISAERKAAEEQRLGALLKFDWSRASQFQAKIQQLDTEKANLEREVAATAPSPSPGPMPVAAADAFRVRCQDVRPMLEAALKIRQRELGAREGQAGAVPLVVLTGQTNEQIAQALAAQLAGPRTDVVGLLDVDGDARLEGVVDVPAAGVYRLVRRRADGTMSVEAFATGGSGAAYGELIRRLDEATIRETKQTLEGLLVTRPASGVRVVGETGQFPDASRRLLAGEVGELARLDGPAARSTEYENLRGDVVRTIETIAPVEGGVMVRRVVIVGRGKDSELWDETTTIIRPVSYWRTEVQMMRSQESRTPAGVLIGQRTVSGPVKVSLER